MDRDSGISRDSIQIPGFFGFYYNINIKQSNDFKAVPSHHGLKFLIPLVPGLGVGHEADLGVGHGFGHLLSSPWWYVLRPKVTLCVQNLKCMSCQLKKPNKKWPLLSSIMPEWWIYLPCCSIIVSSIRAAKKCPHPISGQGVNPLPVGIRASLLPLSWEST